MAPKKLAPKEIAALEELLHKHGIRSGARLSTVEHFAELVARHGHRSPVPLRSLLELLFLLRKYGIVAVDKVLARYFLQPHLAFIKLVFTQQKEEKLMAGIQGPVTLSVGQSTTASVLGFDQFGNPMPSDFVMPPVTFSIDNSALATSTPNADGVTDVIAAVAAGVANLTASVSGPNGTLTDTETVTVTPAVVVPPVLSSIKVAFTPAA
jgi:hypothetical protein